MADCETLCNPIDADRRPSFQQAGEQGFAGIAFGQFRELSGAGRQARMRGEFPHDTPRILLPVIPFRAGGPPAAACAGFLEPLEENEAVVVGFEV
jgi:hypothetical protein